MILVDSHCHLDLLDLTQNKNSLDEVLQEANRLGVQHFLCVSVTLRDFPKVLAIAEQYQAVSASVGLHPNETVEQEPNSDELARLASHDKVVAIGETGLDYYRSQGDITWQCERFRQHIHAAKKVKKPLIVHSRQAKQDTIQILREEKASEIGGVMHCFTEDWEMAQAVLDEGFYISLSGIVTFKNAKEVQQVAKNVPLDRLLIETDSPYLAPEPYRGKPNQPAYVRSVAEYIAALRGISVETLALQTTQNFFTCFKGANRHV